MRGAVDKYIVEKRFDLYQKRAKNRKRPRDKLLSKKCSLRYENIVVEECSASCIKYKNMFVVVKIVAMC